MDSGRLRAPCGRNDYQPRFLSTCSCAVMLFMAARDPVSRVGGRDAELGASCPQVGRQGTASRRRLPANAENREGTQRGFDSRRLHLWLQMRDCETAGGNDSLFDLERLEDVSELVEVPVRVDVARRLHRLVA
jgi:hypothetical protein